MTAPPHACKTILAISRAVRGFRAAGEAERKLMNTPLASATRRRELGHRVSGGYEIVLCWNADDSSTSIEIWQPTTDETMTFTVARDRALDAFQHPFVYLQTASGPG